jgi:TRAP-type mannitol/chloroaromatic compound transport system permease large subunit
VAPSGECSRIETTVNWQTSGVSPPFPFDFCCFRAVTARPITTSFKSALLFLNRCIVMKYLVYNLFNKKCFSH